MNIVSIDNIELKKGAELLKSHWEIPDNYKIYAKKGEKLTVEFSGEEIHITYPLPVSLYRALSLASLAISENQFKKIEETLYFDECGVMLDLSRNGVMKVESIKRYADYMALMGLNQLYLYIEDIYEIEDHPYFGYLRGRYTKEELKEIDEYCASIGVEAIPHIQTLGHMAKYLRWDEADNYRDTAEILLADDETTYEFIKKAIASVSSCFKTKKIHLGMDEAGNLGGGKYYAKNGPRDRKQILLSHIKRVCDIAEEFGLTPIIYGDVLYAVASGGQYAGDSVVLPDEIKNNLPKNLIPVYWNYYSEDYNVYSEKLKAYNSLTGKTIFWGGIWSWQGGTYDAYMTEVLTDPAMRACKDLNIRSAIGSVWQDDGCECNFFLTVHGLMYFAEHMYNKEVDKKLLIKRFEYITKTEYDAFIKMSFFHNDYDNFNDYESYLVRYMGKRYYWADVLVGLIDCEINEKHMSAYYEKLAENYTRFIGKNPLWDEEFTFVKEYISTNAKKCYILENLRNAYLEGNKEFLRECADKLLPELKEAYKLTGSLHRSQWHKVLKPFGYEVLDIRYGGMVSRIETAILRINQYLNGEISEIEELIPERLKLRGFGIRQFAGIISPTGKI
ncbi:MAG: beta-N-acetylhexosaminidase [Ruminococcaceae bacterium]|nr:beta-N-acetylhexosaminidase [Oscillospiraceae bacterium]